MLLGTVLVLLLLGSAGPASAHAAVREAVPEDGSVVKSAPRHVTVTFTESVALLDDSFRVYSPDNHRVKLGEPQHADGRSDTARVDLPDGLDEGTYTVAWRVVSADSHPVSGAFTFSIGKPSPSAPAAPEAPTEHPVTSSLYNTGRYLAYIAATLLIGTVAFAALCRPPDTAPLRAPLVTGWWTLLTVTVVLLVLRAPYENGTSPMTAFDLSAFTGILTGRPGIALLARVALLVLTAAVLLRLSRLTRRREPEAGDRTPPAQLAVGGVLAVALALTWAAAEHASAGIQVPLAMTSSVLHLLATACWLGGLVALLTTLFRAETPLPVATVIRFSRLAFLSVTVLVVTGVYQSWRGLGSWTALGDSAYGRALTAKLVMTAVLLLAAALSRRWTIRLATAAASATETETDAAAGETAGTAEAPAAVAEEAPAAMRQRAPELVTAPAPGKTPPAPPAHLPPDARTSSEPDAPAPDAPAPEASAPDRYRRGLRVSVLAEAAVAAVVLLITSVLTSTLPARAEAEAAKAAESAPIAGLPAATVVTIPYAIGTPDGRGSVQITLDPGRVGENGIQAVAFAPNGALDSIPELRLSFTLEEKDVGPIDAGLTDRGGYWATSDLTLPLPGTWTMKATIRVSDVDQVTESHSIRIDP
ncbi:copper resistance protein CopC/CopD [Streptomyces sp. M2CJ-2]|uniref:copper resistance CopC/CopD family protein n=1 Tax=Streptomyces sp. M2CJ-2 TaxID=2803948 RepID=UPI001923D340|nr:copper resistance protein CopC [Streptomyces sp. M2CJ-2]MBL3665196.1 copper resistance protein CopC/CopD [Streptomyces sp. M2CJ-2]